LGKTCAKTWNFALPKKLDLRKTKLSHDRPSSFCSRYQKICDRTKKMDYTCTCRHRHPVHSQNPECMSQTTTKHMSPWLCVIDSPGTDSTWHHPMICCLRSLRPF
jgi:hypothetical protein